MQRRLFLEFSLCFILWTKDKKKFQSSTPGKKRSEWEWFFGINKCDEWDIWFARLKWKEVSVIEVHFGCAKKCIHFIWLKYTNVDSCIRVETGYWNARRPYFSIALIANAFINVIKKWMHCRERCSSCKINEHKSSHYPSECRNFCVGKTLVNRNAAEAIKARRFFGVNAIDWG